MARQSLNLGTGNNTGDGEGIRDGGVKIEANFTELYEIDGWGYYQDGETSPATQTISTTASKLQIDGAGANTETGYLPHEIRGVSDLWDTTNDKITPVSLGDSYDVRISLTITGKTASPNVLRVILDIGGTSTVTINISEYQIPVVVSTPFNVSVTIPIFCLSTFLTNGGQIFLQTDAGTLTASSRNIFIKRDFKGNI